jgi:hypothetical protein
MPCLPEDSHSPQSLSLGRAEGGPVRFGRNDNYGMGRK